MCFLYLQMIRLKLCNGFSKPYLYFQHIKIKKAFVSEDDDRTDSQDGPDYVFSMHFGSSVKAMRKASTHLTGGPGKGAESEGLGRV